MNRADVLAPVRREVPCGACHACCIGETVVLHPESGDDVSSYQTRQIRSPLTGLPVFMLEHKADHSCVYLGPDGCTIHDRAPTVCREFDCRRMVAMFPRAMRRRLVKEGRMDGNVLKMGQKLIKEHGPATS